MENLREELYKKINKYGLDYSKVIDVDSKLHDEINKNMREQLGRNA